MAVDDRMFSDGRQMPQSQRFDKLSHHAYSVESRWVKREIVSSLSPRNSSFLLGGSPGCPNDTEPKMISDDHRSLRLQNKVSCHQFAKVMFAALLAAWRANFGRSAM